MIRITAIRRALRNIGNLLLVRLNATRAQRYTLPLTPSRGTLEQDETLGNVPLRALRERDTSDPMSSEMEAKGNGQWAASTLYVALALSMATNLFLLWQRDSHSVRELRAPVRGERGSAALSPGVALPALRGRHLNGSEALIDFRTAQVPTLIYVLSPHCVWCLRNQANVAALFERVRGRFRIVCISLAAGGLAEYIRDNNLDLGQVEVVFDVPKTLVKAYRLRATPETLVISTDSKLVKLWRGAYGLDTQREVEEYFGVRLPGLTN